MIFSHKERLYPSVLLCSSINSLSHSLSMSRSATGGTDFLQLSFPRKGSGQMNPDFPSALYYPGSDFNDFEADGVELGRGPLCSF